MPAKSTVKPPGPDYALNPQRPTNPFTTAAESDWIHKSDLLAADFPPLLPASPQQKQTQIPPPTTATPTPPALTPRPSVGAPRKLPPPFNLADLPPLPARSNTFTIPKTPSTISLPARTSLEISQPHPGKLAKPPPPTVPRKPAVLSREAQRTAALDMQVSGGGRQTRLLPPPPLKRVSTLPVAGRPALPPRDGSSEVEQGKGKGLMDDGTGGDIEWVPLRPV